MTLNEELGFAAHMAKFTPFLVFILCLCRLCAYEAREPRLREYNNFAVIAQVLVVEQKKELRDNLVYSSASLEVLEPLRGEPGKQITINTEHPALPGQTVMDLALLAYRYEIGRQYVVMLSPDRELGLRTSWFYEIKNGCITLGEIQAKELSLQPHADVPTYIKALKDRIGSTVAH